MSAIRRRVAIIGAGPAGAIATDALVKEQAFEVIRVFDRQGAVGGTWIYTDNTDRGIPNLEDVVNGRADKRITIPPSLPAETEAADEVNSFKARFSDTAAHENLHSNLPPDIMCFTQEPLPEVFSALSLEKYGPNPPFRHRDVMRSWVEDVFTRGQYQNLVQLNTTIELAEKIKEEWVLTLRKPTENGKNYWWQEKFDSLVVATGHYYIPAIPSIPGLVEYDRRFPGRILHSKHYPNVETFRNKRVIVVGGAVSAFDALHDIRTVSKKPVISSLRRVHPLFGQAPFIHPDIENHNQISAFEPDTGQITFADGTSVKDVDFILFATGFDFSVPFLPQLSGIKKRIPGLYEHVFKMDDPSLAFIGMVTGGFGIRIFEWQAVAAARVLSGRARLPSIELMQKWEQDRLKERGEGSPFWTLMPDFEKYFIALRAIAGDPKPGTTGRELPEFDPAWEDSFWRLIKTREQWWKNDAAAASATQPRL